MAKLTYLVVEYVPRLLSSGIRAEWARIDGHYAKREDAEDVAAVLAESPLHPESRIVVVEIKAEAKAPASWEHRSCK